jgi:hypothetical protein
MEKMWINLFFFSFAYFCFLDFAEFAYFMKLDHYFLWCVWSGLYKKNFKFLIYLFFNLIDWYSGLEKKPGFFKISTYPRAFGWVSGGWMGFSGWFKNNQNFQKRSKNPIICFTIMYFLYSESWIWCRMEKQRLFIKNLNILK